MSAKTLNEAEFQSEVLDSDVPVLVDFWAEWCPPCRVLGPIVDEVGDEVGDRAKVVKIDVDSNAELAGRYEVRSIPTTIVFKGGEVISRGVGVETKEQLLERLSD